MEPQQTSPCPNPEDTHTHEPEQPGEPHQEKEEDAAADPYHHCRGGWSACCARNARVMRRALATAPAQKYLGEFAYTYADWWWGNELFFEQLPRPSSGRRGARPLPPTACGLCYACVAAYYERAEARRAPCPFPQPPGTYAKWYAARVREWFSPPPKNKQAPRCLVE